MASAGELYVSLGVKGADKTVGAITQVKDGLKGIASTSLETKAAILASIYALERLFEASGKRGTALENFNQLTGVATKTIQQYQWAAQQVGVSNEAVSNTFVNLQKKMTDTLLGKGAPEGLGMLARTLGRNISAEEIADWQKHPEKEMQVLQEYAHKEQNIPLRNKVLESMGAGQEIIPALDRNAFTPQALNKAPTYSDAQIQQLDKARAAWANLSTTVEMMFGKLNAKHGLEFVKDIQKLLPPIEKVINALVTFAEKIKLFEGLGKVFDFAAKSITAIGNAVTEVNKEIEGTKKDPEKMKFIEATKNAGGSFIDMLTDLVLTVEGVPNKPKHTNTAEKQSGVTYFKDKLSSTGKSIEKSIVPEYLKKFIHNNYGQSHPMAPKSLAPGASSITPKEPLAANAPATQNISVNQTMTFQSDESNPRQVAHAFKRDIQSAARQLSSLGQGT